MDLDIASAQKTVDMLAVEAPNCAFQVERCDASNHSSLVSALRTANHPIDLFCANAGVATVGDCSAADAAWQKTWELNVMQTVWAADELVPSMAARGGGAILVTASAAGLLTQLGSAPYAVTKHAAVGLAEWLAITYGEAGLAVCCVCPQGVNTPMITAAPTDGDSAVVTNAASVDGLLEAEEVAAEALQCLAEGRFLCMPGDERGPAKHVLRKGADRERWIVGMRRLQAKLAPKS